MIESTFYLPVDLFQADAVDPAQVVGVTASGIPWGRPRAGACEPRAPNASGVFLLRMGDELRPKRVQRVAGGAWILISDNPAYEPEMIAPDRMNNVAVLGRIKTRLGDIA